jgi:hypothetical protein
MLQEGTISEEDFQYVDFEDPILEGECISYDAGIPNHERYYKNIIPKNYSIFNREGIESGQPIDTTSEQGWLDDYYYPVLPKYNKYGNFSEDDFYPYSNIPFPLEGNITQEDSSDASLKLNITSNIIENNILDDLSGNQNIGAEISDYKPKFDDNSKPDKIKKMNRIKKNKINGAF